MVYFYKTNVMQKLRTYTKIRCPGCGKTMHYLTKGDDFRHFRGTAVFCCMSQNFVHTHAPGYGDVLVYAPDLVKFDYTNYLFVN